jgi:formylglycine-generating enzyme required for sulfatase activity
MNYIPPGTFEMGCTEEMNDMGEEEGCDSDEFPVHDVTLTQGFYIGITEVTQGQWETVMGSNPSDFTACGDNCPVEQISWEDAVDFANELSVLDGLIVVYDADGNVDLAADGYRLPTEAEWEYAARADDGTRFSGSNDIEEVAWYTANSEDRTHPVAELDPNGFGLYDMSGNIMEWCGDWFSEDYYDTSPTTDPTGPASGSLRVARSGEWSDAARYGRISDRRTGLPEVISNRRGLRLVRTVHTD